jgi:hypothetical protein
MCVFRIDCNNSDFRPSSLRTTPSNFTEFVISVACPLLPSIVFRISSFPGICQNHLRVFLEEMSSQFLYFLLSSLQSNSNFHLITILLSLSGLSRLRGTCWKLPGESWPCNLLGEDGSTICLQSLLSGSNHIPCV